MEPVSEWPGGSFQASEASKMALLGRSKIRSRTSTASWEPRGVKGAGAGAGGPSGHWKSEMNKVGKTTGNIWTRLDKFHSLLWDELGSNLI